MRWTTSPTVLTMRAATVEAPPAGTGTSGAENPTVTVRGVELVSSGTWDASTGRARITTTDLQSMIDAAANGLADAAPVKIGHDDDRFQDADGNPPSTRDGEPAYGWITNLRLNEQYTRRDGSTVKAGTTLIGDLVGVPRMLAEIMDTAFRRRSVEVRRGERIGDRRYPAVLTALSLLGVQAPAVKGLADLRELFHEQLDVAPETFSVLIEDNDTPTVPQTTPENPERHPGQTGTEGDTVKLTTALRKALNIADNASDADIRAALRKAGLSLAEGEQIEHDTRTIESNTDTTAPVTSAGDGSTPAAAQSTQPPAASSATSQPAATTPTPAAAAAPATTPAGGENAGGATSLAAANVTPQMILAEASRMGLQIVDSVQFAALEADAAAGRAARDEQDRQRRDQLVRTAVQENRIDPAAYDRFREMADRDENGVIEILAVLPRRAGGRPVGHGGTGTAQAPASATALSAGDTDAAAAQAERRQVFEAFQIPVPDSMNS